MENKKVEIMGFSALFLSIMAICYFVHKEANFYNQTYGSIDNSNLLRVELSSENPDKGILEEELDTILIGELNTLPEYRDEKSGKKQKKFLKIYKEAVMDNNEFEELGLSYGDFMTSDGFYFIPDLKRDKKIGWIEGNLVYPGTSMAVNNKATDNFYSQLKKVGFDLISTTQSSSPGLEIVEFKYSEVFDKEGKGDARYNILKDFNKICKDFGIIYDSGFDIEWAGETNLFMITAKKKDFYEKKGYGLILKDGTSELHFEKTPQKIAEETRYNEDERSRY